MRAFRLESFAPVVAAKAQADPEPDRVRAAAREEGYEAGYVAGQAAATEAHAEDQSKLTAALVEALADGHMTNEAARRAVLAEVAPLVAKLFGALAPTLADLALPDEIARRVEAALRAVPSARPRIRCAPEVVPTVEATLARFGSAAGAVEAGHDLLPREAEVAWAQGFDRIDLDAAIAEIRGALAAHLNLKDEDDAERRYG
jgi:hypothetical protein